MDVNRSSMEKGEPSKVSVNGTPLSVRWLSLAKPTKLVRSNIVNGLCDMSSDVRLGIRLQTSACRVDSWFLANDRTWSLVSNLGAVGDMDVRKLWDMLRRVSWASGRVGKTSTKQPDNERSFRPPT